MACQICSERTEEPNKLINDVSLSRQYSPVLLKTPKIKEKINERKLKEQIVEGFGIIEWENKSIFKGNIKDNYANGWGKYYHPLNGEYKGEYLNDQPNGYGIYSHITNSYYEGMWKNEKQDGIGIENWTDNSIYKGEFENGKKKGIGEYIFPDGKIYFGEWDNNNMNGYGIYYYNEGDIYYGKWKNGVKDGYGEIYGKNTWFFSGFFKNNAQNGFFIYYNINNDKLIVGFKLNGKINGICKIFDSDENEKVYLFHEGKKVKEIKNNQQLEFFVSEDNQKFLYFFLTPKNELEDYLQNKINIDSNRKELDNIFQHTNSLC